MRASRLLSLLLGSALLVGFAPPSGSAPESPGRAAEHWTAARRAAAIPRDLVLDEEGRGYLRHPDGRLEPYGSSARPTPEAKPGGGGGGGPSADTTAPSIAVVSPAEDQVVPTTHVFSADVQDPSGIRAVAFLVTVGGTTTQHTASGPSAGGVWSATVSGLAAGGSGSWQVRATDGAKRGGNTTTSDPVAFSVEAADGEPDPEPPPSGEVVTNAAWSGGVVQTAAGRIYFEMRSSPRRYSGYVCSGTVATDGTSGRSVIITAAHCVYDDVYNEFARNVLFIPNQAGTAPGAGTDRDCSNDPIGCWEPTHGVVDSDWASRSWPDNIPWDFAYYVVPDAAAYTPGLTTTSPVLDGAAGSLPVHFGGATQGAYTHALGYSYSEDPKFMYCAEGLATDGGGESDPLWLGQCGLSGGASGGPWVQPMGSNGSGPIVSVNSYGYGSQPGMGGPHLLAEASCVFGVAKGGVTNTTRGFVASC